MAAKRGERRRGGARGRTGRRGLGVLFALFLGTSLLARFAPKPAVGRSTGPWVDPAAVRLGEPPRWADPRWARALEDCLATAPPFAVGDRAALGELRQRITALPFVREVRRLAADADRGLELELALRRPEACLRTDRGLWLVSGDGVVLPGRWPAAPLLDGAPLPEIASPGDRELFAEARPGDWLALPRHRDALATARSLARHLSPAVRRRLGPVAIDASHGRVERVDDPGVVLRLAEGRECWFGRPPSLDAPGELPARLKWRALERALELTGPAGTWTWTRLDCRWDRPDLVLAQAQASVVAVPTRRAGPRGHPARLAGHARVR